MIEEHKVSYASDKRAALVAMLGIAAVSSLATWVFAGNELATSLTIILSIIAPLFFLISWCSADAKERNFDFTTGQKIFIILFALIGLPYYFFKSRESGKALTSTALALLFWILTYFVSVITLLCLSLIEDRLGVFVPKTT
jgi:UDP-N-acetylmuramyl pentapeptide phosphotransferase/UDP-N-acetylglucosamine-1-phosphate transferase